MEDRRHLLEANTPLETLQTSYIKYKAVITTITVFALILLGCGIIAVAIYNVITHGREAPDMLIYGCTVWTGDQSRPNAESVAIVKGKIVYVGTDDDVARKYPPVNGTQVVNATGMFCTPGFIDSHIHLLSAGLFLTEIDLSLVTSVDQFTQTVSQYAATKKQGAWIVGGRWNTELWGGVTPNCSWIDSVTLSNPVFLSHSSGHLALVNSVTLNMFNITKDTKNPPGGEIGKDVNGNLNCLLYDEAMKLVAVPEPTHEQEDAALILAMQKLNSFGITSVVNMGEWKEYLAHKRLRESGKLTVRIASTTPLAQWELLHNEMKKISESGKDPREDDWLSLGMLKGFADGALGTHTAALLEDYSDAPGNKGLLVTEPSDLLKWTTQADANKLQVAIHAIGDRANREVLSIFANVTQTNGKRDRRFRIEHAQQIKKEDMQSFQSHNVIASYQPIHLIDDLVFAPRLIGDRIHDLYRWGTMNNYTKTVFGSDWYVASPDVRLGIFAAMARQSTNYPEGFDLDESVSIESVLKSYTSNAAYAMFRESKVGTIREGYLADIAIWGGDLTQIAFNEDWDILKTIPVKVVVNGQLV